MLKRLLDISVAMIVLIALAIPFAVIAIILRFSGEGEVFYLQDRVGLHGKIFRVFKFATMLKDSPSLQGGDLTVREDPRILPVGKFLRQTKINELPQFINVLRGDMSLVGWRPLMPVGFQEYTQQMQEAIVVVRPGITGLGSIVFRDEELIITKAAEAGRDLKATYRDDILPYKGALELWYADHANLWTDLKILLVTGLVILLPNWSSYRSWFPNLPAPQSARLLEYLGATTSDGSVPLS